jgi:rfaE bifunctional protein kinase chain/domain
MPLTPGARADKPGGAGNVAAILLALGAAVRVLGVVGDDDNGRRLLTDLQARGADVSGVVTDPARPTTHKLRILAGRQQLLRIDTESSLPLDEGLCSRLYEAFRAALGGADVVLISDYAKGVLCEGALPAGTIAQARAAGIPVCADPKPANIDLFRDASLVSPNESEARLAAGPISSAAGPGDASLPAAVVAAGRVLRERLRAEAVFITRGDHGIAVFGPDDGIAHVPAIRGSGDVGDATGCGDAVSASSALTLAAGASYLEAAEIANAAGGVVSRFVGVHSPTAEEILARLHDGRAD